MSDHALAIIGALVFGFGLGSIWGEHLERTDGWYWRRSRRAAPRETTPINQCDGCRRGVPVNKNGHHEINDYPGEVMACTADRYRRAAPERKETQ